MTPSTIRREPNATGRPRPMRHDMSDQQNNQGGSMIDDSEAPDQFEQWVRHVARERLLHYGYTEDAVAKAEADDALMDEDHESLGCVYERESGWDCTDANDHLNHRQADRLRDEMEAAQFFGESGAYAPPEPGPDECLCGGADGVTDQKCPACVRRDVLVPLTMGTIVCADGHHDICVDHETCQCGCHMNTTPGREA